MKKTKQVTALFMTVCMILAALSCPIDNVQAAGADLDNPTVFTFSEKGIVVSGAESSSYKIEGNDLTINGAGTYMVTGTCTDGQVKVKKGTTDVFLIVNNLNLTSADTAPMLFNSSTEVELILQGNSSIRDTTLNNDETNPDNADAENATLKSKASSTLVISGDGSLAITGNGKNALKANGSLVINSGTLDITSVDDGINNESSVVINGGTINIDAEGDGIKSEADDSPTGSVTINGGTVNVDSMGDGIQATANLTINGGNIEIMTYGGCKATYDKDDDSYPSAKGLKASGSYEITDESTGETTEVDATECDLKITGGTIIVNSADDAIHANRNATIIGGNLTIQSGDDGIHADYVTTIGSYGASDDSLVISMPYSVEGIEGAVVNMQAGTTRIFATDDGVNAANSDFSSYDFQLNIVGGNHFISCSSGDGVDSNNSLTVFGGTTVVLASSGSGEGNPIDCDGQLNIYGGKIIGIGTSGGAMSATVKSGVYVTYGSSKGNSGGGGRPGSGFGNSSSTGSVSIQATNSVAVTDSSSNELLNTIAEWIDNPSSYNANYVIYADASLESGSTYNLLVNGSSVASATATGNIAANIPTFTPTVTEEPAPSNEPVASEVPVISEDPIVSNEPTISKKPVTSNTPQTSTNPVSSEDTETSQNPVSSIQPSVSKEPVTSNIPSDSFLIGDADKDGDIDLTDAQLTLKAALKIISTVEIKCADIDGDNTLTLNDAQTILKKALKIIP